MPKPQLPEIISYLRYHEEEMIKSKPQIRTADKRESNTKGILDGESLSPSSSSSDTTIATTTTAESPSIEVPSAEISSKREGKATAIDKRELAKEKNKKNKNKNR